MRFLVWILGAALFVFPLERLAGEGVVVAVYDGDTIKVRFEAGLERKVRLLGVDAPEMDATEEDIWLQARFSKRFAFRSLFRKRVRLLFDATEEDDYGRLLAYVRIDGVLFNEKIIQKGFARAYRRFSYRLRERFLRAEQIARQEGRGLWKERPYPLVPVKNLSAAVGTLSRVEFVCERARKKGACFALEARGGAFAALIPEESIGLFSDLHRFRGEGLEVWGFLEIWRSQPQILVYLPRQIRVTEKSANMKMSGLTGRPSLFINPVRLRKTASNPVV